MKTNYDVREFNRKADLIIREIERKGEVAKKYSALISCKPDMELMFIETLLLFVPSMVGNFISTCSTGYMIRNTPKRLDPTYDSYTNFPNESYRTPLYDESGCLTRVPFPDELIVSPIDQHGTCGISVD